MNQHLPGVLHTLEPTLNHYGYLSGSHINAIYNDATRYDTYVAIAFGVLLLAYIARRVVRVRRSRAPNPPETGGIT